MGRVIVPGAFFSALFFERAARRAAKAAFREKYPSKRPRVARVVERTADAVVVFVQYHRPVDDDSDGYHFFRVSRTTLASEECRAPADWFDI